MSVLDEKPKRKVYLKLDSTMAVAYYSFSEHGHIRNYGAPSARLLSYIMFPQFHFKILIQPKTI